MPVYDYKCKSCGLKQDAYREISQRNRPLTCPNCKGKMFKTISIPVKDSWKPITLEHINVTGEGPLHFEKKKDLQRYCKENGLSSGALL
jgi:putative FmdB family regulatory protein